MTNHNGHRGRPPTPVAPAATRPDLTPVFSDAQAHPPGVANASASGGPAEDPAQGDDLKSTREFVAKVYKLTPEDAKHLEAITDKDALLAVAERLAPNRNTR